jgi:hypothetical protein
MPRIVPKCRLRGVVDGASITRTMRGKSRYVFLPGQQIVLLSGFRHCGTTGFIDEDFERYPGIGTSHSEAEGMSLNTKRRLILTSLALFALLVLCVLYLCHRVPPTIPAHQSQVEALNDALKNGLLTKSQYDAEIKKLKDEPHTGSQP